MIKGMNQKGFTLIELMLAMSLFSIIFILSTAGFIGINRTYTRGALKKQLSETTQRLTDNISGILSVPQGASPELCTTSGASCPDDNYNRLCFTGVRYVWPRPIGNNPGGLHVDNKDCEETFNTNAAREIVDSRFVVEDLKASAVIGSRDLYYIKGVLHTADMNALRTTSSDTTADRSAASFDPYSLRCKGSSAGLLVQSCAVEQFDTIVASRGSI